jgi:hypothetical protein
MKTDLTSSLAKCLDGMTRTDDIEATLGEFPERAEELRPLVRTAALVRRYYDTPLESPPGGLRAGRAQLLAEAAQYRKKAASRPVHPREQRAGRRFLLKFATALLAAVIALVSVSTGVAWAAKDSLPGETLYPVKLASEDLQLSLASDPAARVGLSLQFAARRAEEIQAMVRDGQSIPESVINRMKNHYEQALQQASTASPEETPGLLEQVSQQTQTQAQFMEQLQSSASQETQVRLQHAQQMCLRIHHDTQTMMGAPGPSTPGPHGATPEATPADPGQAESTVTPVQQQEKEQKQEQEQTGGGEQEREREEEGEGGQERKQEEAGDTEGEQERNQEEQGDQERRQQQTSTPTSPDTPGGQGEGPEEPEGQGEKKGTATPGKGQSEKGNSD